MQKINKYDICLLNKTAKNTNSFWVRKQIVSFKKQHTKKTTMSNSDANCVSFPLSPPKTGEIARSQTVCKAVSKN